ncbi:MAG TPA: DUF4845 domain-containing protein [Rhodanobacteraceae bacterium]|nr:DUF4845 domain-containing protein [Rhodanobacteraceae bacterium]
MKRQRGLTLIGFVFILIIAAFFALMAMRLVPSYVEYFGVVKAMKAVAQEPDAAQKSLAEIQRDLDFKASFQYVDDTTLGHQTVRVDRSGGKANLVVDYNKKVHFLYNISFLLHFAKTVPLSGTPG